MLWLLSAILPLSMLMLTTPTHMSRGGRSLWRKEKRWPCLSVSLLVSCSTWKQQRGGPLWNIETCITMNLLGTLSLPSCQRPLPCHAPHYEGARPHLAPHLLLYKWCLAHLAAIWLKPSHGQGCTCWPHLVQQWTQCAAPRPQFNAALWKGKEQWAEGIQFGMGPFVDFHLRRMSICICPFDWQECLFSAVGT